MATPVRIGIDLGGTKIEIIALSATGQTLWQTRIATPSGDYRATLEAMARLVEQAERQLQTRATVGIGLPGSLSPASGRMRNANSVCLNGQPLRDDIETLLQRPVAIANDANCFTLSEATDGAAAGARSVFGVIVGTGTGAGLVFGGEIIEGCNGVAGEWGHNPLPWPNEEEWPGPDCWCGKQGCLETWLSGPGMAADHTRHSGQTLDARAIADAASHGDNAANDTLERYEQRMARGLAHIINTFDPEVIVLGGGLSNIDRLYTRVPALWKHWVFSDCVRTRLTPPRFGDASGVRGAAWLGATTEPVP